MPNPILVTGGTGTIGSRVVPLLVAAGREVRTLSRHPLQREGDGIHHYIGDVSTGAGLPEALDGTEAVLHLAGGAKGDDAAARVLGAAAQTSGIEHLLLLSVVGAGRMPIGYFRMKDAAERAVQDAGVPWTVLRAAQLHEFVLPLVRGLARVPLVPAPRGMRFEPVDVTAVADRLASLTLGTASGRVPDIAGPEVLSIPDLVRTYAELHGRPRRMLPFRLPGQIGQAYAAGANLTDGDAERAGRTWREWLEQDRVPIG